MPMLWTPKNCERAINAVLLANRKQLSKSSNNNTYFMAISQLARLTDNNDMFIYSDTFSYANAHKSVFL